MFVAVNSAHSAHAQKNIDILYYKVLTYRHNLNIWLLVYIINISLEYGWGFYEAAACSTQQP